MRRLINSTARLVCRIVLAVRKARFVWLVRCLEIELHDKIEASDACRNDSERIDNSLARRILQRELVHARMRLAEFSKPGERTTYEVA